MTADIEHAYGWFSKQESNYNRLREIGTIKLTVTHAAADIWFRVVVERVTPETEVRGRLIGPRSLFAEQNETVVPLRSVKDNDERQPAMIVRTAIPNPAFWNPRNPWLYRVIIELWQDGQRCDLSGFDLGFDMVEMGSDCILVNKEPIFLQGMASLPQTQEDATAKRRAGYNLVFSGRGDWHWWVRANPMGFLLLEKVALSTLTPAYTGLLRQQPCFLGFVLDKQLLDHSSSETERFLRYWQEQGVFVGLELQVFPPTLLPPGLTFLVCPEAMLPALASTPLPKIALRRSITRNDEPAAIATQGVLGFIDI